MCFLVYALIVRDRLCVTNCVNYIHGRMYVGNANTRVEKRNLRSSGIERMVRDITRITLASIQLEDESQIWLERVTTSRDLETMTWDDFRRLFMGK